MHRYEVVQRILDLYAEPNYLEVGVQDGFTFHYLKAARKVAVDPVFRFDVEAALAQPLNAGAHYHQIPSDAYFAGAGAGEAFDVIYLDGLHTFDQTLRDLLNAMGALKPNGTIILDDTLPNSYAASLPDEIASGQLRVATEPDNHAWMGDVYRCVFFMRDYLPQLSYATVNENHGQTVIWREQRPAPAAPHTVEAIARLDYAAMRLNLQDFHILPLVDIEAKLKAANG